MATDRIVAVHRTDTGQLTKTLRGHRDIVTCVSYSSHGSYLGSGSLGIWRPNTKSIPKCSSSFKILCCSWRNDGRFFAIGTINGIITIRNKALEEILRFNSEDTSPIWCLCWNNASKEENHVLAVGDWSRKLTFYRIGMKQVESEVGTTKQQLSVVQKGCKDQLLDFNPCCLTWTGAPNHNEALIVGGSDGQSAVYTSDGCRMTSLPCMSAWIWGCAANPNNCDQITFCCQDGSVATVQLGTTTVHGLYRDIYAYRGSLSDVVIRNLSTGQKSTIKFRDYVKKIAVYQNRLAGKASRCWKFEAPIRYVSIIGGAPKQEAILVGLDNGEVMQVLLNNPFPIQLIKTDNAVGVRCALLNRNLDKLGVVDDNSMLRVYALASRELLFQESNVLTIAWSTTHNDLLSFSGTDSSLSIKAANFPAYSQQAKGLVVKFTGSQLYLLYGTSIERINVSLGPAMYAYMATNQLDAARDLAPHGLTSSDWKVLARQALKKLSLDVARWAYTQLDDYPMMIFIDQLKTRHHRGEWCDLDQLADSGLCLARGDASAYLGDFDEAVAFYTRVNNPEGLRRTIDLYIDLRQFERAIEAVRQLGEGGDSLVDRRHLLVKHADWLVSTNQLRSAVQLYCEAADYAQAIKLAGQQGWTDVLLDISRQLNKGDCRLIEQCATELIKCGQPMFAAQCFVKSGNFTRQLELCVEARNWDEALSIVEDHSELKSKLYLPYANWLAENDRFEDAQAAFSQAGLQQEAMRVLRQLADSAACESRFDDAAFYNWKLSLQCLDLLLGDCQAGQIQMLEQYCDFQKKADVYYAYAKLMQFLNGELLSKRRSKLYAFNLTLFLVNAIQDDEFESVSKASILYTLGEQAEQLKAYHLLHSIYDRLHFLNLTPEMRQRVELTSLLARPRQKVTVTDDSLVPSTTTCFRCSTENSLLNKSGIACVHCKHPFFYSLSTFEQLPLVEFALQDNISHDQALQFLSIAEQTKAQNREQDQHFGYSDEDGMSDDHLWGDGYKRTFLYTTSMLGMRMFARALFEQDYIDTIPSVNHDTFTTHRFTAIQFDASKIAQFQLDVDTLRTIALSEVLIVDFKEPFGRRYYKIMQPGVNIKACSTCKKIFDTDDFRRELLYTERCPFCRSAPA